MKKRYVARRDRLKVGHGDTIGEVHGGEAFPAADAEASHSLLGLGWVSEGRGTLPVNDATHGAFADGELADHAPADPAAVKAFRKARAEAEAAAAAAAGEPIETAPAAPAAKKAPAKKRKAPAAKKGAKK